MLAHMSIYLGFLEESDKLWQFPEITQSDTACLKWNNYNINTHTPIHSGKYDVRLFDALTNHFRKIIITKNEPISLSNVHKLALDEFRGHSEISNLEIANSKISDYLASNMGSVTQVKISLPGSALETTSVFDLLNNYFAALIQHSKPNAQEIITELNMLTYGTLPEMIRVMIIDLITLLKSYVSILRLLLKI